MTNKIKNIFLILLLSFVFLFFTSTTVFGSDSKTVDGVTYNCNSSYLSSKFFDDYNYFCLVTAPGGTKPRLFCSDKKFTLDYSVATFSESPAHFVVFNMTSYTYNESTNTYKWDGDSRSVFATSNLENTQLVYDITPHIDDSYIFVSGNVVFCQPLEEMILAPIMEKTPLEEVMREILGILPVVLITIVGLISLRKGLQLLSTVLHRS